MAGINLDETFVIIQEDNEDYFAFSGSIIKDEEDEQGRHYIHLIDNFTDDLHYIPLFIKGVTIRTFHNKVNMRDFLLKFWEHPIPVANELKN